MTAQQRVFWSLLAATLLLYLPISLSGDFIWDDPKLVELNQWTGSFSNVGRMFTQDLWASTPLGAGEFFYYRPMMLLSLTLDQSLGFGPVGHHAHSLFWHLLCVGLLLRLARETKASPSALFVGVSLFALHPLQTEVLAHVAAPSTRWQPLGSWGLFSFSCRERPLEPHFLERPASPPWECFPKRVPILLLSFSGASTECASRVPRTRHAMRPSCFH